MGKGLMGYPHPVRSWQGTLYLHNGKCFQMRSYLSYKCAGALCSWAYLVKRILLMVILNKITSKIKASVLSWKYSAKSQPCSLLSYFHPIRELHSKHFCIKLSDWIIGTYEGTWMIFLSWALWLPSGQSVILNQFSLLILSCWCVEHSTLNRNIEYIMLKNSQDA